ncbi:hypothetical protein CBM2598_U10191 [Cupriavidus taiwanensis]|uniref:Uncharacterized protein n=1 Tax=Cupriavidus taiwanensis TaxID=164546 RepID=A0A7Z7NQ45_9BURK|nr:hypothetical protein CBM2597_U10160 [Cupriavidus taiwanensis]SOZ96387.1 hypothetical protein CBM2598_U10191 [Cupriavidus taiwanensis]SPC25666.1 hypothetical protein CBM2594_U10167 [Cupriavidus taiwanensis]
MRTFHRFPSQPPVQTHSLSEPLRLLTGPCRLRRSTLRRVNSRYPGLAVFGGRVGGSGKSLFSESPTIIHASNPAPSMEGCCSPRASA